MFKRCAAAQLLMTVGMLVLGFVMALVVVPFIPQQAQHHHRDHGREQRLLERQNNDASTVPNPNW